MSARKARAGQPEAMAAGGESVNWAQAKANQLRIGDEFLLSISDRRSAEKQVGRSLDGSQRGVLHGA